MHQWLNVLIWWTKRVLPDQTWFLGQWPSYAIGGCLNVTGESGNRSRVQIFLLNWPHESRQRRSCKKCQHETEPQGVCDGLCMTQSADRVLLGSGLKVHMFKVLRWAQSCNKQSPYSKKVRLTASAAKVFCRFALWKFLFLLQDVHSTHMVTLVLSDIKAHLSSH